MTAERAQRWLVAALLALVAVLVFTGVWLMFRYRPDHNLPVARVVHRLSAYLAVLAAVGLLAVAAVRRAPWALAALVVPLLVAITFIGDLLPWDQLGLWAVTINGDFAGVLKAAFDGQVRFILIGGAEVSQSTYRLWLILHAALTVALAVVAALLVARAPLKAAPDVPPPS